MEKPVTIPSQALKQKQPHSKEKRWTDEDNNPCLAEANASFQCLHDHNFDRDRCTGEFMNYKNCKKFWGQIMKERRQQGIKPVLPGIEERQKILGAV